MTITYKTGDIFTSEADALAQGCNTAGIMASGIAEQFAERFPVMFQNYHQKCLSGTFTSGTGHIFQNPQKPHVINLATQGEDREAKLEYIDSCFNWMKQALPNTEIQKVAMPRIASGLGGLVWEDVNELLESHFKDHKELEIELWSRNGNY